jgi:predicted alpha/beta hydrolase family esterase
MKRQIVIIHGGNAFEKYEDYIAYLTAKELRIEKLLSQGWKLNLGQKLGNTYQVLNPQMPNSLNARYAEWKIWFEKIIPLLDDTVAFIGHSLGGIFLAKYLSENTYPKKIRATFLIAAPYNTKDQHPLVDFIITEDLSLFAQQAGEVFLYQSTDDMVVPFENVTSYQKALPNAQIRIFKDKQHFNQEEFPELIADIVSLN